MRRFLLIASTTSVIACNRGPDSPTTKTTPDVAVKKVPPVQPTAELAESMAKLSFLRGVWEGKAHGVDRTGSYEVTQVERVGPMLGGDVLVIEGRGFRPDGTTGFNAFGIVSFDQRTHEYEMRSYAQGHAGTFELQVSPTGYVWELPAGPNTVIRFTATIHGDSWHEEGALAIEGQPPKSVFDMELHRTSDTDWPLGTPATPTALR